MNKNECFQIDKCLSYGWVSFQDTGSFVVVQRMQGEYMLTQKI